MSFTVLVIIYAILPTLVYLVIGLYILSLEQKKGPGYKSLAVIYFISVPSLILIGATLTFSMNYMTGKYEAGTRAPGYELYKFLVLKDIIPRSDLNLDDKSNQQNLIITEKKDLNKEKPTELYSKENPNGKYEGEKKMTFPMVKARCFGLMEIIMREIGRMANQKELVKNCLP